MSTEEDLSSSSEQLVVDVGLLSDSTSLGFTVQNSNWALNEATGFSSFASLISSARSSSLSK